MFIIPFTVSPEISKIITFSKSGEDSAIAQSGVADLPCQIVKMISTSKGCYIVSTAIIYPFSKLSHPLLHSSCRHRAHSSSTPVSPYSYPLR